ncbi:hypothetical protein MGALJ_09760 [Mycobacterium gallinarum]|uniref:4Fe-4S Wbl-type domain-containing protein n=1 Tax=Mycobacterium gallinarum TaxID=39689 RepID=A0A9W4BBW1_9MYCO|nr:hypothetical protein [Mycobacterium gallinarum]BBY91307.1 hypothetical protein MGALJ_09760 [Mycobacterium gallinarum]
MSDWNTIGALLAGVPDLPGARCAGRWDLYERTVREYRVDGRLTRQELETARTTALRLCETCPVLQPCREYLQGLPISHRPPGVIAGQVITTSGRTLGTRT